MSTPYSRKLKQMPDEELRHEWRRWENIITQIFVDKQRRLRAIRKMNQVIKELKQRPCNAQLLK
jgi:hypothetical protein